MKLRDHLKISLISTLGYWVIRIIGSTLHWEIMDRRHLDAIKNAGRNLIMVFWHGRIFMASYYFRRRGIVVMISQNRDGEYIARIIQRFGYSVARGSSTRGGHSAMRETLRALEMGNDVGFAIDGPRGPRYIAKPGAAYTAWKTGKPIVPFCISVDKKWVMRSWDHFQVPKPFSRAVVLIGEPISIDARAGEEEIKSAETRIQQSLDELRNRGDNWWGAHEEPGA